MDAAKRQDRQAVQLLLKQGIDVNTPQGDGATALHWAAYWDDLPTADLLIRAGANVNAANDLGATPLFLACSNGSGTMVDRLLRAGAKPDLPVTPTTTAEAPLMTAARTGSLQAVKALLASGANANAAEKVRGQTALMWAAANRHPDIVRALLAAGADVKARTHIERMRVMIAGRGSRLGGTRENIRDVDQGGFTPLLFAARSGDIESAQLLVAAGADVNDAAPDGTSVLVLAAHSGQGVFARYLLDRGADPNVDPSGYTALHAAVLRGDLALVESLLAHRANPNVRLKDGTPITRTSKDFALSTEWIGATPFWLAANFAESEIMRALAAAGADAAITIPDGTTALMAAAGVGSGRERRNRRLEPSEIVALAESGDAERRSLAAVRFLVAELGADVNAANADGDTAVHGATSRGETSVVEWLAERGARLDLKNKRGQTPLSIASTFTRTDADEGGVDTEMVALLRRLGVAQ